MDIVISIVSKIAESLVTPIGREFGYLIYYDTNMKDLKGELKQLFDMKDGVQELVKAAKRNGGVINSDVQSWLTSVNELIQKVSHFEEEVNMKRRCLYRWNMSRKATKITQVVLHLQKKGTFNNVAHPAPPPMISSAFKEGFKDFKSRMTSVNRVIEVLKNEEVRMIGICGMGGVGKTTMVKEIIKRLEGLKVFDNIVMAVVSQTPDIQKIQSEIAEQLRFKYDENTESGRARRLHGTLMEINRILIVLDDVWTELDFEAIGLPSGLTHKGCKVLLTSRNEDVCKAMGSKEIFTLPVLTEEESWELFREMVGEPLDYPDLAKQVTNECADFNLTIQATKRFYISNREEKGWFIGDKLPSTSNGCYAFENKLDIVQSDATEFMKIQIVRHLFTKCEDLFMGEIKNLKHVLNELDQEGLQHLKVLRIWRCPEIEYLVNGASWTQQTAFPLIQSIQLMEMPKLKAICHDQLPQSSFINLRSLELHYCFDLKYAFSLSVASNLVQLQSLEVRWCPQMKEIVSKEWREDETASDIIAFPKLTNLTLQFLSNEFIGFYEANRLYSNHEDQNVVGTSYDEHQSSRSFERAVFPSKCILWLQNLEEVTLEYANGIVDVLFDLKGHMVPAFSHLRKLEISFGIIQYLWKNIPRGFQGFQNLRYLKIEHCRDLQYVFPHSIARLLVNLEELNIAECWKMETIVRSADENEKVDQTGMTLFPKLNSFNLYGLPSLESLCPDASTSLWSAAKVMSVKRCDKLKTLASVIPQIKKLEKDSTAHHEDEDEGISSGSCGCTPYSCGPMTEPTSRRNIVQILPRPVNQEVAPTNLDQDSNDYDNLERLSVYYCESLEVVFQLKGPKAVESHNVQALNKLCYLSLYKLPSLMHVWETGGSQHITGFGNLTFLSVSHCGSLRYLFLSTVAKLLVSLKDLEVGNCKKIKQVIAKADTECADQEITFPRLNSMTLEYLPNLICFSTEAYTLKLPSLMELKVIRCPDLRTFASKVVNTHSVIQVRTELGKSEWMGDLNSTIGNIHEKRYAPECLLHVDEEDEFSSEEYNEEQVDEEVNTDSTE
ncbi:hypothetical protein ACE6H2_023270 [Prunus campanulata]